jgi:prevent-host-death family protein
MTKQIDALSARTHFGEVMQKAQQNNVRFLVSRRGKPAVVIMGVNDYLQNVLKEPTILAEINQEGIGSEFGEKNAEEIKATVDQAGEEQVEK